MPGPRMGARPPDFDEEAIRQSPTFAKWAKLEKGEKMRYACRDFVKGQENDEERLMRRIMIARRNNIRDHEVLKKARRVVGEESAAPVAPTEGRKRRPPSTFSDGFVASEMDVPAVEATRSYRAWMALEDGQEFVYNQKYIKGKDGHDWLLRKNIWRRMRYRRENKKMVTQLIETNSSTVNDTQNNNKNSNEQQMASQIVDQALAPLPADDKEEEAKKVGVPTEEGYPARSTRAVGSATADATAVDKNTAMGTKRPAATTRTSARKAAKVAKEVQEPEESQQSQTYQGEPVAAAATTTTTSAAAAETQVQEEEEPEASMEEEADAEEAHPHHHHHTDDDAAVTAAAAATASGAADDLVELSAVEAAVAAAASYVQLTTQQQGTEDHGEDVDVNVENDVEQDEHANTATAVHNPLEAAANAAALDSAAKLAAAAAAQDNKEGEDDQNESTELVQL